MAAKSMGIISEGKEAVDDTGCRLDWTFLLRKMTRRETKVDVPQNFETSEQLQVVFTCTLPKLELITVASCQRTGSKQMCSQTFQFTRNNVERFIHRFVERLFFIIRMNGRTVFENRFTVSVYHNRKRV